MRVVAVFLFTAIAVLGLLFFSALNPPKAEAVPSYARQTGLPCSGCHYAPPELNPAGRRFKLLGYVDRGDDTKTVKADGGKKTRRAGSSRFTSPFRNAGDFIYLHQVSIAGHQ